MASFLIASAGVTVDGTTDNDTFGVITGASAITVNGLAGDDTVTLSASAVTLGDSLIALGDDDDTVQITTASTTGLNYESATIRGGGGDDTINIGAISSEINVLDVRGNEGDDTFQIDLTSIEGTASSLTVLGGEGEDTISVTSDDDVQDLYVGGGKDGDTITYLGGTFSDSTLIGGFGEDTASAGMDVDSSLIQLGNGTDGATDSADVLAFSGVIANSTVKGGAGGDTITMQLDDNSTATIIEGNAGIDTLNLSAGGDYESTEIRAGAGDDTINFSGVQGAAISADIFGGAGEDDINISNATGIIIEGGAGSDTIEWQTGNASYRMDFGDSNEGDTDTIGTDALHTGSTVDFIVEGSDVAIKTAETVTTSVDGTEYQLAFSGGVVFFGDTGISDITAAVDFMDAALGDDVAAVFSFATGRNAAAGDEFYLFVKGNSDENDLLVEMTNAGAGLTQTGGYALTEANSFGNTELTFTV